MNEWLYILDGHEPLHFDGGLVAWTIWMAEHDTVVANDTIGDVRVSTVFIGMDQTLGRKPKPIVFETMIFGGEDHYQVRCATWDEAVAEHAVALARVRVALAGVRGRLQ